MSEQEDRKPETPQRRRFLRWLAGGFLSLWGVGFVWVLGAFVKPPVSRRRSTETVINLGELNSIPAGQAKLVRHGDEPIFVVHTQDKSLVGLSAVCTHLDCVLAWDADEGVLRCPCHDGTFDINGNVLGGPPPRPLKRFRVEVRLGEVFLHLV